jgi:4-hydroxybenzoate polyprenyltransferase
MEDGAGPPPRRPAVLDLLRPVTLFPVLVIALLFGMLGAGRVVWGLSFLDLLLAGGLLVVANGLSNIINGLGDWVEDSVHPTKQERPTVSGALDPSVLLSAAIIGWGAALLLSVVFLPRTFSVLYIAILGFAWVYSYPPRLKSRFPMNMLCIATPRGALGIAAAWSVFGSILDPRLWVVLAVTVPYVLLANESRNIEDREADAFAGVQTVATIYGERAARVVTWAGFVAPLLVVLGLGLYRADPWLLVVALPLVIVTATRGWSRWNGKRLWYLFYGGLGLIGVLFFLTLL